MTVVETQRTRADVALRNAERAKQSTREKLAAALLLIASELEANGGVYTANPRGLSRAEVARRASIADVTLAKPRHKSTREWVDAEVKRLKFNRSQGKKSVRRTHAERLSEIAADNKALRTQIIIHELERAQAERRSHETEAANAALREELAQFKRQSIQPIRSEAGG